jgi:hypothetical protein
MKKALFYDNFQAKIMENGIACGPRPGISPLSRDLPGRSRISVRVRDI